MKYSALILPVFCIFILLCGKGKPGDKIPEPDDSAGGKVYQVVDVYVSEDKHAIFFDSEDKKEIPLIHDRDSVFDILYKTGDNKWVIAQKAPAAAGEGRIETTDMLFYTPESEHIDIESLNPDLSGQGIHFTAAFNEPHLAVYLKGCDVPVPVSFEALIAGRIPDIPVISGRDKVPQSTGKEKVILELKLGKEEGQIGQGDTSKQFKGGTIYAMPSFAVRENLLYIVDAINFRVLVYDLNGSPVSKTGYPQNTDDGKTVIMRDIAVDDDFIYLLSSTGLYITDSETEDIVTVIDKDDTPTEGLQNFQNVELSGDGKIHIFDFNNNKMYSYEKEKQGFKFIGSEQYFNSSSQHLAEKKYTVSAYGKHKGRNSGRYFIIKRKDNSILGIFDSGHSQCRAGIFSVDLKGYIYVIIDQDEQSGAQFPGMRTVSVISPEGKQLYSLEVKSWPGGPMNRNLIVTETGEIFQAFYDLETGLEDDPASKLTVRRIK